MVQILSRSVRPRAIEGYRGKDCDDCLWFGVYPISIHGEIYVEFNVRTKFVPPLELVPPLEEEESEHVNFEGRFTIVGGDGFYDGITGRGTINGTYHGHEAGWAGAYPDDAYLDFVMLGDASF